LNDQPHILYCHCAHTDLVPEGRKTEVLDHLRRSGLVFEAVPDLCGLVARKDPILQQIARQPAVRIIACYPRAIRWLWAAAGVPFDAERFEVLNMREQSADEIILALTSDDPATKEPTAFDPESVRPHPFDKKPWFPVIDYDRCTDCRQCLDFCLFGVYTASDDNKVHVTNPTRCKTDCPACARLCPPAAIMFPKYTDSPINGDEVRDEAHHREAAKASAAALAATDVRTLLRDRGARRFASQYDPERALQEREQCAAQDGEQHPSSDGE
jgi:NAD-dependent dihydropyrimidine dehydrogenase PreA subunit